MAQNDGTSVKPFTFGAGGENGADDDAADVDERVSHLASLHPTVRGRVAAARKLQMEQINAEVELHQKLYELECSFRDRFSGIRQRMQDVVSGKVEPTAEDTAYPLFTESEDELAEKLKELTVAPEKGGETPVGIPEFWLTVLRSAELTSEMIHDCDEEPLKYLTEITATLTDEPMGFELQFHFAKNPFFTNAVLAKKYYMKCAVNPKDPADFDGPEFFRCEGCEIDWLPDKNTTVKFVKKKQKSKKTAGQTRFTTKRVKADSFFNFFAPPPHTGDDDEDENMDDGDRMLLHLDFEIAHALRDSIVPRALFYFTGEADDMDGDDEYADDEDSEGDDEDED